MLDSIKALCSAESFSILPWFLAFLVGALTTFLALRPQIFRLIKASKSHALKYQDLVEQHKLQMSALKDAYGAEIKSIQEVKQLVWVHFDGNGKAYTCPGCHQKQDQKKVGPN